MCKDLNHMSVGREEGERELQSTIMSWEMTVHTTGKEM